MWLRCGGSAHLIWNPHKGNHKAYWRIWPQLFMPWWHPDWMTVTSALYPAAFGQCLTEAATDPNTVVRILTRASCSEHFTIRAQVPGWFPDPVLFLVHFGPDPLRIPSPKPTCTLRSSQKHSFLFTHSLRYSGWLHRVGLFTHTAMMAFQRPSEISSGTFFKLCIATDFLCYWLTVFISILVLLKMSKFFYLWKVLGGRQNNSPTPSLCLFCLKNRCRCPDLDSSG